MMNKSRFVLSRLVQLCNSRPLPPPPPPQTCKVTRSHYLSPSYHRYSCASSSGPQYPWWYHSACKIAIAILGTSGTLAAVHLRYHETVPFTGRTHLVVYSPEEARKRAEHGFAMFKKEHASKILGPTHPDTVRVHAIVDKILAATRSALMVEERPRPTSSGLTDLVDRLDWEVIVIPDAPGFAKCFFGAGKIIVTTKLLRLFNTDAEIAYNIAHEVGHVVARHSSEMISLRVRSPLAQLLVLPLYPLVLPFFRRNELEADHIGMLLHTAAGYDPHAALQVWHKYLEMEEGTAMTMKRRLRKLLDVHPSIKKRLHLLSQPKVMEEALDLYRRVNMI